MENGKRTVYYRRLNKGFSSYQINRLEYENYIKVDVSQKDKENILITKS